MKKPRFPTLMPPTHGGAREGAGRPSADGAENLTRHQVLLDPDTLEICKSLGNGQLSPGIRKAAAIARAQRSRK